MSNPLAAIAPMRLMSPTGRAPSKNPANSERVIMNRQAMVMNALNMRTQFLTQLLDNRRDIDKECGYPEVVTVQYCRQLYDREGIAKRVVRIFPEECWKSDPEVLEDEDSDDTAFEEDWKALVEDKNLYSFLQRADILSGVGHYGVILLGIDDGLPLGMPIKGLPLDGTQPKKVPKYNLLYLRTFDESVVKVASYETNSKSPRYGQPNTYNINFIQVGSQADTWSNSVQALAPAPQQSTTVHWTRIIHLADNLENSEVFGVPRMQPVINRLYDLRKVLAASGEGYWKGGFPGISFEVNPEIAQVGDIDKDEMRAEFEAYQDGLQRYLSLVGVTAKSLQVQATDPTAHFTTHIKAIACALGVPWRILMGTEEAQLASTQDSTAWNERVEGRRTKYVSPKVIKPFVQRLTWLGVVSPMKPDKKGNICHPVIVWPDLHTPSDLDRAELADTLADAMSKYVSSGADVLMPPEIFLSKVLNFSDEEVTAIMKEIGKYLATTGDDGIKDAISPPPAPPTAPAPFIHPQTGKALPGAVAGGVPLPGAATAPAGKAGGAVKASGKVASAKPSTSPKKAGAPSK